MPSLLYVLDEIPVSTSGKIQRKMLFEILNSRYPHVLASGKTEKPTWSEKDMSDTEGQLARIWMEILDVKSVDPSDNFFDLGGDSLAAAELFVAIEETFGVQISLDDLFASKTLGELARRVESGSKSDYRFLVKIKNGNVGKPLFLVHTIGGDIVTYHAISKKMRADRRVWGIKFSREADWEHPIDFGQLADRYIAEIKRIQPQGPYRLMGYCHGGVLAYYLACRLKERGEEVELLAMLDSVMGSLSAGKGHFGIKKRFWYALVDLRDRNVQEFTALVAKKTASFFRVLKHKAQYRIYDHVCRGGSKRLLKFVSSLVMLKRAKEDTPLERYEGKMHYFLPMRTAKGSAPSIDYWKRMAQEVEVVEFTGTHNDMMSEKAAILAKKIEEILEKADG
jgi:thioesterase domain-containing protein/acyl carrier protein